MINHCKAVTSAEISSLKPEVIQFTDIYTKKSKHCYIQEGIIFKYL